MARRLTLALADKALDGNLEKRLRDLRDEGLTFDAIADTLRAEGIDISRETARRWAIQLGVEKAAS